MRLLILCLTLLSGPASAVEFISYSGRVSDEAFYRMVACAAPPGGSCTKPFTRWPVYKSERLTVGIALVNADFPDYKRAWVEAALGGAVAEINSVGADIRLRLVDDGSSVDIPVFLTGTARGGVIRDTGFRGLDGSTIQAGLMTLWWRNGEIRASGIALSKDLRRRSIRSVVLEELVQALGLATDLRNPAYAKRSIFDEDSNAVIRLTGQDAEALRRHYPRRVGVTSNASD